MQDGKSYVGDSRLLLRRLRLVILLSVSFWVHAIVMAQRRFTNHCASPILNRVRTLSKQSSLDRSMEVGIGGGDYSAGRGTDSRAGAVNG